MNKQDVMTVRRPIISILSDLRVYASTNSAFNKRWADQGVDFTEECLNSRMEALVEKRRTGLRKLLPVSPAVKEKSRWSILRAWADTAGVTTWVKVPKR